MSRRRLERHAAAAGVLGCLVLLIAVGVVLTEGVWFR